MARYYHLDPKDTVQQVKRIELPWLLKNGYLCGNANGVLSWNFAGRPSGSIRIRVNTMDNYPYIHLQYKTKRFNQDWEDLDYKLCMEGESCRYGGKKWFFICNCNRKVRVLYQHESYFKCRICANLSYESCNQSRGYRSGQFKFIAKYLSCDDFYKDVIKRKTYKGKITKRYKRFLEKNYMSDGDIFIAEREINRLLLRK